MNEKKRIIVHKTKDRINHIRSFWVIIGVLCMLAGMDKTLLYVEAAQAAEEIQETEEATEESADKSEADITPLSQIMTATEAVEMKAEPSENAETLMTYEKDALVFVTGETADGWYQVSYQDKEGFVQESALTVQEIDVEGLDAEMAAQEEETKFVVEAVEKYRVEARRSKIWGSIIVVLVVGIFSIGIVSAIRANRKEKESDIEADIHDTDKSSGENRNLQELEMEDLDKEQAEEKQEK